MKIDKELLKGSTTMLVLNLLKGSNMYGYEMIKKLKEKVDELLKYKGHLLDSSDTLYTSTKTYYDLSRIMERLYVYANLKLHEDMAVSKNQVLVGKLICYLMKYLHHLLFILQKF